MNLPHHRRYQWPLGRWRNVKYLVYAIVCMVFLVTIYYFASQTLFEKSARIQAETAHKALIADVKYLASFGAPGTTKTDLKEGTMTLGDLNIKRK